MGDFEEERFSESNIPKKNPRSRMIVVVLLLLGLFAPFVMMQYSFEWMSDLTIQALFWVYHASSSNYSYNGFSIIPIFALITMFPLVLLRIVPVTQVNRYYNGKTSRKRALVASMFGDGLFLFYGLLVMFLTLGYGGMLFLPLPFQMIFGFFMLWKFPISEPTTPWEGVSKPKSWWEKKTESKQEKPAADEDEDKLW